MKNVLLMLVASQVLVGCDQISSWLFDPERVSPGTIAAVESCIEKNKSEILSTDATRAACAHKHQRPVSLQESSFLTGRLGFSGGTAYGTKSGDQVNVTIQNKSSEFVVSAVGVSVYRLDFKVGDVWTESVGVSGPIWVEPGQLIIETISLDKEIEYLKDGKPVYGWQYIPQKVFVISVSSDPE